jgi:biotin-(acetyl-CoA carboxylase) ligase
LKKGEALQIGDAYDRLLLGYHAWRNYRMPDGTVIEGKVLGVDESGMLRIESRSGALSHFAHHEVEFML